MRSTPRTTEDLSGAADAPPQTCRWRLPGGPAAALACALFSLIGPSPAIAAGPDNDIEWTGVSHVAFQDRRPVCPVNRESFQVRFQTYRNDITSARVRVDDGAIAWVAASLVGARGPYDVWAAQVPATTADTLSYLIELTDGTDTDYYGTAGMSESLPADRDFLVDYVTLGHAPLGATLVTGGTVFKVWAPTRTSVHVRGQFNGWGLGNPMTKVGEHFVAYVPNTADRQQYRYFFSDSLWRSDARGRAFNPADNNNNFIENPFRYTWQVADFATPAFEEMVVYQLHVGTFAGRNDPLGSTPFPSRYQDVAARAGHLAELGVNAVMLNPITEFPGDHSAGYNPMTMWAPEWKYGTPDDLKAMVDALHQQGIAVLLDIVWNHFTINDNFMWYYDGSQIYFDNPHVDTPWGAQADFDELEVRDYYAHSALYWLEEFHLDGFRMDATDYMTVFPQEAAGWALMRRFNDEIDNRWANKIAIAEQLPDDASITRPTSLGGAGFDAQYYDLFTDQLRQEIFDAALGDPEMWKIRDIVNGSGAYLSGRSVLNYLELHDEAWPESGGQRIVKQIDTTSPHDDVYARGRVKLAQGLVMFAPGIPAFLMGTEWLEDTDFGTQFENRLDWSKKTTYAPIFAYFKDIIRLRRSAGALRADADRQVYHLNESGNVIGFRRFDAESTFVIVANFGNSDYPSYRIGLPIPGNWYEIVNSQATAYGGSGLVNPGPIPTEVVSADGFAYSATIALPAMGLLVLGLDPPAVAVSGPPTSKADALRFGRIAPSPARPDARIEYSLPRAGAVSLTVHDAQGRRVATLLEGVREAGTHLARWNGRNDSGQSVGAGVYFLRLESGAETASAKLVLLQ